MVKLEVYSRFSKICLVLAFICLFSIPTAQNVVAQEYDAIASYYPIAEKDVRPGMIVSFDGDQYYISTKENDQNLLGVTTGTPTAAFNIIDFPNAVPVVTYGEALVLVNAKNGPIGAGEYISTSDERGVGIRTNSGFAIGNALENFSPPNTSDTKLIRVKINPQQINQQRKSIISLILGEENQFFSKNESLSVKIISYIAAAACSFVLLIICLILYGKSVLKSIKKHRITNKENFLYAVLLFIVTAILIFIVGVTALLVSLIL